MFMSVLLIKHGVLLAYRKHCNTIQCHSIEMTMRISHTDRITTTIGVQSALERSEWRYVDALLLTQQEMILIDEGVGR